MGRFRAPRLVRRTRRPGACGVRLVDRRDRARRSLARADAGRDLVIAGGYDALSEFVATGFEALGATTASALAPFRVAIATGWRSVRAPRSSRSFERPKRGGPTGTFSDFRRRTTRSTSRRPTPRVAGSRAAARAALADAVRRRERHRPRERARDRDAPQRRARRPERSPRCSAGTTPTPWCIPSRPTIGHCLGASGALEALAALGCHATGVCPRRAATGPSNRDSVPPPRVRNEAGNARACLKLSSGFGGSNAALVVASLGGSARIAHERAPCRARGHVARFACSRSGRMGRRAVVRRHRAVSRRRTRRASSGSRRGAPSRPRRSHRRSARCGSAASTLVSASSSARSWRASKRTPVSSGAPRKGRARRRTEAVRAHVPNLPAGECAIAFGFLGPAFAVGGGPNAALEALLVSSELIATGDVDTVVAVVCDEVGHGRRRYFRPRACPFQLTAPAPWSWCRNGWRALSRRLGSSLELLAGAPLAVSGEVLFRTALSKATGS